MINTEGVARLLSSEPLEGFSKAQWIVLLTDTQRFLDRWGKDEAIASWSDNDLFGVTQSLDNQNRALPRVGQRLGLVLVIMGGDVVQFTPDRATIEMNHSGSRLSYPRGTSFVAVPIWGLVAISPLQPHLPLNPLHQLIPPPNDLFSSLHEKF